MVQWPPKKGVPSSAPPSQRRGSSWRSSARPSSARPSSARPSSSSVPAANVHDAAAESYAAYQEEVSSLNPPDVSVPDIDLTTATSEHSAASEWWGPRPGGYSLVEFMALRVESDTARVSGTRWQDRGPVVNDGSPKPDVWRNQPLRPISGKYMKRGGRVVKAKK